MTKREKVIRALNCEPTPPPIYDLIRNDAVIECYTGCKLTIENGREMTMLAMSKMLDATKQFMRFPQEEAVAKVDGRIIEQKRWTSWEVWDGDYNREGGKQRLKKIIDEYKRWTEIEQMELERNLDDLKEKQSYMPDVTIFMSGGCGGPYTLSSLVGGFAKLSYLISDEPVLVSECLEVMFQLSLDGINHLPSHLLSPAVLIGEDIAFKSGLIFSPLFLRREFFSRFRMIVDAYHQKGYKVIFHSDGNIMEIMDDLVDCGIDGLNPIETMAGVSLKVLRKRYPNLILIGGIDCSQLLPYGDVEKVKEAVRQAIRDTKYGYFVGSSSEIHNEIPLENVLAMVEAVKNFGNETKL